MDHRNILSCFFVSTTLYGVAVLNEIDQVRYEEGKKHFELMQHQAEMPKYGRCWLNAMTDMQNGCKLLNDQKQTRLALSYLNCFLQIQDRPGYSCDPEEDLGECTVGMNDADRSSLTTFFTHSQNICYFLQAQVWQEATENTIDRLTHRSSQVAEQLEEARQMQQDMLSTQNESLLNQLHLMKEAQRLSFIINNSSDNVRSLFEDLKQSTKEQSQIIGDVFDQLTKLRSTILGEVSVFYSIIYYFLSILVCYLLTSTPRTSGARIWLFLVMSVNVILEQTMRWIILEDEQLYWLQRHCRRLFMLIALVVLVMCAYMYQDINAVNNQLLVEIRRQNSETLKFITGKANLFQGRSQLAVADSIRTSETTIETDSDYTTDEENSEAESDKTYILPDDAGRDSDNESFLTIQDDEASRSSLLSELYDLRNATPVRDINKGGDGFVQAWLKSGCQSIESPDEKTRTSEYLHSADEDSLHSPRYNLRPRLQTPKANTSPAMQVESAASFSRTVKQLQQIAEKNSRILCAQYDNTHLELPASRPWNGTQPHAVTSSQYNPSAQDYNSRNVRSTRSSISRN